MSANLESSNALVGAMIGGGLSHVVLCPGSRSTPLALALDQAARDRRITLHPTLDERSAAFFALGLARGSGRPTLMVTTSGSAGAHALPAVIEAFESGVPLVVITADRPPELHGVGAPQTTPQHALFGVHAKLRIDLPVPCAEVSARVFAHAGLRAIERACAPRPGPVHLDAPFREPLWSPGEVASPLHFEPPRAIAGARRLDVPALREIASWLSPRGVIVAGPLEGIDHFRPVLALAERLGWPVIADAASNLRAGGHPNVITRGDAIARSKAAGERFAPEIVLELGRAPSSKAIHEWLCKTAQDRVVVVDDASDHGHLARAVIACSPAELFADLYAHVAARAPSRWLADWQRADRIASRTIDAPSNKLWEGQIARAIAAQVGPGTLVHLGSGMPVRDFDACGGALAAGVRVYSSRGANGIDGTTSTALGVLAAHEARDPGARMISIAGDLTTLHDLSGLRMARGRDATLVVVDNGGGGIFDFLPIAAHPESYQRCFRTPQEADFLAIARGLGLDAAEVTTPDALANAIASPGLIRVPIDARHNVDTHRERYAESARRIDHELSEGERT